MSACNVEMERRAAFAIVALKHLDKLGCTVNAIDLAHTHPVLRIDAPHSAFLKGALKTRVVVEGVANTVMVASVCDCVAEWKESYAMPTPREAMQS